MWSLIRLIYAIICKCTVVQGRYERQLIETTEYGTTVLPLARVKQVKSSSRNQLGIWGFWWVCSDECREVLPYFVASTFQVCLMVLLLVVGSVLFFSAYRPTMPAVIILVAFRLLISCYIGTARQWLLKIHFLLPVVDFQVTTFFSLSRVKNTVVLYSYCRVRTVLEPVPGTRYQVL